MKNSSEKVTKICRICTNSCIFAFMIFVLLTNQAVYGHFNLEVLLTKDNIPSRLTSVAHLGGLLFLKGWKI